MSTNNRFWQNFCRKNTTDGYHIYSSIGTLCMQTKLCTINSEIEVWKIILKDFQNKKMKINVPKKLLCLHQRAWNHFSIQSNKIIIK